VLSERMMKKNQTLSFPPLPLALAAPTSAPTASGPTPRAGRTHRSERIPPHRRGEDDAEALEES
jgi:hypothetical protein